MQIKKVGVLGCGLMGSGIAQVAAIAGFETIVKEVSSDLIEKGLAGSISRSRSLRKKEQSQANSKKRFAGGCQEQLRSTTSPIVTSLLKLSSRTSTRNAERIRSLMPCANRKPFLLRTRLRYQLLK